MKQRAVKQGLEGNGVGGVGNSNIACNEQSKRQQSFKLQLKIGVLLMAAFYMSHMFLGGTPADSRLDSGLDQRMEAPTTKATTTTTTTTVRPEETTPVATVATPASTATNPAAATSTAATAQTSPTNNVRRAEAATTTTTTPKPVAKPTEKAKLPPIHGQTLKVIAPHYDKWSDEAVHQEFETALQKIKDAPIIHEPFDHFFVKDLFSDTFYKALMEELPPPSTYHSGPYPGTSPTYRALHVSSDIRNGTHVHVPEQCFNQRPDKHKAAGSDLTTKRNKAGCWLEDVQLHDTKARNGLTLTVDQDASKYPLWVQAFRLVHSRNFTHLLYSKFASDTGIPQYKQDEVQRQAAGDGGAQPGTKIAKLRNTAALRIEPTSYHLTPHVDRYEKLVTWQYFHPETMELANRTVGTQFYEIKPEFQNKFEIQDKRNPAWLGYDHFNSIKEQPVIPNYFFSFAPNNHSWHGAAIDPDKMRGVNQYARRTFLGFVTTSYWGFHHFNKGDWAPEEFDFTATV